MCCLTTLLIDKFTQTRTDREDVTRHNDEDRIWIELTEINGIMNGKIYTEVFHNF